MVSRTDHLGLVVDDLEGYARLFQRLGFRLLSGTTRHGGSAEPELAGAPPGSA